VAEESAEQIRAEHIRDMGRDLGDVYNALWKEVVWLHAKWDQYRQLYAHSPARVDFLNKVAGHFVGVVQDTLYDDILLHLTRLTDRSKGTLNLQRLPKLVPPPLAPELDQLVRDACLACKCAEASRNQRLAHTEFALALAGTFDDSPSRADVEAALGAVRAVLDRLEVHYWKRETGGYQHFFSNGGDADSLLYYLRKGVQAEERRRERILQEKPLPEGLEPEDEV
jgi:AbiU2